MLSGHGHGELKQGPAATTTPDWDVLKNGYIMKRAAAGSSMLDWEEEEEGEGERDMGHSKATKIFPCEVF